MKRINEILRKSKLLNKLKKDCKFYWIDHKYTERCHLDLKRCYFCKDFIKDEEEK